MSEVFKCSVVSYVSIVVSDHDVEFGEEGQAVDRGDGSDQQPRQLGAAAATDAAAAVADDTDADQQLYADAIELDAQQRLPGHTM